jgi:hypothetical protein
MSEHTTALQQLYMVYLNRPADPEGLAYWEQVTASGASMESIAAGFAASTEYQQTHKGQTHQQMVESFYESLFGRAGDAEGVAYWTAAMDKGVSTSEIGNAILHGAQTADAAVVAAKTAAAGSFTAMLAQQDSATVTALLPKAALWLSGVTSASSHASAMAALPEIVANALQPVVLDVENAVRGRDGIIHVDVTFSSAVYVDTAGGTPSLVMDTGARDSAAKYLSGSGSNVLTFEFVVKAGDYTTDLDYASMAALALNGATITDAAGHTAVLTLPTPGAAHSLSANGTLKIDVVSPLLASSSPGDSNTAVATDANIVLHFNEKMDNMVISTVTFIIEDLAGKQRIEISSTDAFRKAISMSDDGTTIILNPQLGLLSNTDYKVSVLGRLADVAGNLWDTTHTPFEYLQPDKGAEVILRFTTGAVPVPTLSADGGTLHVSGHSSGNQLVIDLNQHTSSEGKVPGGTFTQLDLTQFDSGVKVQALDGQVNHLNGTIYSDTLIGGNAVNGVAAVNVLRGGESSDILVAGTGSDNIFSYALSEFNMNNVNEIIHGMETISNWGGGKSNTISFDGLNLSTQGASGTGIMNGNYPATMYIKDNGLAMFDIAGSGYQDHIMANSDVFYLAWYVDEALKKAPAGTSAVFNLKDDAYLVLVTGTSWYGTTMNQLIKLTGVHSDGLVFDANGAITGASFIANA